MLNLKPAPETLFIVSIKALTITIITIPVMFKLLFKRQRFFYYYYFLFFSQTLTSVLQ